jgi:hypothetical protein
MPIPNDCCLSLTMNDCPDKNTPDDDELIAVTRTWVDKAVIGLNLCPFAKAVQVRGQVRYVVSRAATPEALYEDLRRELDLLASTDPEEIDTTLLIHPDVLTDFLDYNDFLDVADATLEELDLDGQIQVASFHPDYRFAGTAEDDVGNATNRSPFPMLHLLREASIERAVAAIPEAADIYEKNILTMENLGHEGWKKLLQDIATAAKSPGAVQKN